MASALNRKSGFKPRSEYAPLGRETRMRRAGRRTRDWEKHRRALKREFDAAGNTTCELGLPGCMRDDGLGFAHALKRRHITNDADMRRVALLCNFCHSVIELQGEAKMCRVIDSIIARRAA